MGLPEWLRPPRQIPVLFLAITLGATAALVWMGWQMIAHDRALETQRTLEHLDHAADHLTAALQLTLAALEEQLPRWASAPGTKAPPEHVIVVVASPQDVQVFPARPLLYYPVLPVLDEVPVAVFAAGEAAEYQQNDPAEAVEIFRAQARSPNAAVRAGALLRLGRTLRKVGQHSKALEVYQELARLGSTRVGGRPAELVASEARCRVWAELQRPAELKREAAALYARLFDGRWRLDRAAWEFHEAEVREWLGSSPPAAAAQPAVFLADVVERLWAQWKSKPVLRGRRFLTVGGTPILVAWSATATRLTALATEPDYLQSIWYEELKSLSVQGALSDGEGRLVLGGLNGVFHSQVVRGPAATGLPWTLQVAGSATERAMAALANRQRTVIATFALVALLVATGGYFVARAITRELAVARLQSEFVAAVSHELRTPLTSLRQLTELLSRDRVPAGQRSRVYEIMSGETERLHGLVEELLDFARMEAGAVSYRMEPVEPGELLVSLVAGFQHQVAPQGYRVELSVPADLPVIQGDREALTRAVRNLLDNAVKYSPESRTVWVEAQRQDERVAVRVRDCGVGIPAAERQEIFKKFVRGKSPIVDRVKGTGLGLAMVAHVVRAHGGEVRVDSELGQGSTFTLLLPLKEEA